jgi:hypothetical protein
MFGMKRIEKLEAEVERLWVAKGRKFRLINQANARIDILSRQCDRLLIKSHSHGDIETEVASLRRDLNLLLERTGYKVVHCEQDYWYLESMPEGVP